MKSHCAFSKNHSCPLWTDYELTCYELEEQTHYVMATGLKLNVNTNIFKHCKKSYQIMISHIPTNMILTNYLRGPGIIPDPQTRPSSLSLKPDPQTRPSNQTLKNWHSKRTSPSRLTLN